MAYNMSDGTWRCLAVWEVVDHAWQTWGICLSNLENEITDPVSVYN